MSIIEMFRLKNRDERLIAEVNKIYAIAYFILSFGILFDFYYGLSRMQIALENGLFTHAFDYVSPIGLIVFMLAQTVGAVLMTKRGVINTNRFVNTDRFPVGYHLIVSGAAAIGAGLAAMLLRILAEAQVFGFADITRESWMVGGNIGLSLAITIFLGLFILFYLTFKIAKRRERKSLAALEEV
jgi:hypothetical protein